MLAAGILVLVRTLGAFELTFFVSAADTQTLVVALFGAISDPGGVPGPLTAAMAVTYMLVAVLGLAVSLRFVTPSQAIRQRHR
jgi:putative spermidine/putrescine transport system permease protein